MPLRKDVMGAILAGGTSSRMGSDKATLLLGGVPLIAYAAHTLTSVFSDVVVSSGKAPRYSFLGLPEITDIIEDRGPLGGIHACLAAAKGRPVFVLASDLPFVTPALVEYLLHARSHQQTVVASDGDNVQPLCGIYDPTSLPHLERCLEEASLSVMKALVGLGKYTTLQIGPQLRFFHPHLLHNINSPNDIHAHLRSSLENQKERTSEAHRSHEH
jgi:molybdopterin-guanine dinucleotide biosynthesis protein A